MKKNKIAALFMAAALLMGTLTACATSDTESTAKPTAATKTAVNIAVLAGPTGIGAVELMQSNDKGTAANDYTFTVATAPDQITGKIVSGEIDIAAVPTNLAAVLYAKTGGKIQIAAINTLGVLYILENGDTVNAIEDLRGKTIYATGQGSNPEYVLNYLLLKNGLEPGTDVTVEYKASEELVALMASGQVNLAMLPVPAATSVMIKNTSVRSALDLTEQWDALAEDTESVLTQGCIIIRKEFAEENPDAVDAFLTEYAASIDYVVSNVDDAAQLVADYGITGSAEIAKAAIPNCNLVCITGDDMKPSMEAYYEVLFAAAPTSLGGQIPDDGIYYTKK